MEFVEFAKRLGIVEIRYLRIIEEFFEKKAQVFPIIEGALLSTAAKQFLSEYLQSRLERLQ